MPTLCAALAALLAICVVTPLAAQPAPASKPQSGLKAALQKDLDAYLKERSVKEHLSALSLAVSLGQGQPTIEVTSGTTKYQTGNGVTPSNLFQIGSNTKAFTAVAILQLEAKGRLSIDAPLGNYLPQYPEVREPDPAQAPQHDRRHRILRQDARRGERCTHRTRWPTSSKTR